MSGPGLGQTSLYPAEPAPEPLLCWLWLSWSLGAGSGRAGQVLDAFGGAQEAWEARETDAFRQAMGKPAAERANQPDNTPLHYRAYARRCAAITFKTQSSASSNCLLPSSFSYSVK